jgi:hypothetical protein
MILFQIKKILFKSFDNYSEAAKYLNCSTRSISRYVDKNKLLKKNDFYLLKILMISKPVSVVSKVSKVR